MFTEREIGRAFKLELEKQKYMVSDVNQKESYTTRFKVYLNKPVQSHKLKFQKFWKSKNLDLKDLPPSQPEIDMILVDDLGIWRAIEIKVIKKTRNGLSRSYYHGLGQTLAYLSYGVDEVGLWHCFDGDSLTDKEIFEYNYALGMIRAPIEQFVDLTNFKISRENQQLRIKSGIIVNNEIRTWKDGVGIYQPENRTFKWRCKSSNPFLKPFSSKGGIFYFNQNVVRKVGAVRQFIELQKTEVWDKENTNNN